MLEKVVAAVAAAGGLVLAGAGLAVADVQDGVTSSHNVAGNSGVVDACVVSHDRQDHTTPSSPPASHTPEAPHKSQHPHVTPKPEEPHHPAEPQEHQKPEQPDQPEQPQSGQPRPDAPSGPDASEELAKTGAPEAGLTLVTGAGLLLGGVVLYRRARVARR